MTISTFDAGNLAMAYADAMELTSRRSYHPQTTPHKVLETYLHYSKVTGVVLHNEHWLAYAEQVVEDLNKSRREAMAKAFGRK